MCHTKRRHVQELQLFTLHPQSSSCFASLMCTVDALPTAPTIQRVRGCSWGVQSVQLAKVSNYLVVAIDEQLSSWCSERGFNVWYKDIQVRSPDLACSRGPHGPASAGCMLVLDCLRRQHRLLVCIGGRAPQYEETIRTWCPVPLPAWLQARQGQCYKGDDTRACQLDLVDGVLA